MVFFLSQVIKKTRGIVRIYIFFSSQNNFLNEDFFLTRDGESQVGSQPDIRRPN